METSHSRFIDPDPQAASLCGSHGTSRMDDMTMLTIQTRLMPAVDGWKEAAFVGYFGPIGKFFPGPDAHH